MNSLRRRLENLEKNTQPSEDEEQIKRGISHRIHMTISDELANLRAPRFIPGQKDPKDRTGPSLLKELYGPAWTYGQWWELAIRNVFFDCLEQCLSPGFNTGDDYLQYLDEEDLSQEGRERAAQLWIEAERLRHEESWDEVNKWERERREKAVEEEWRE